MSQERRVFVNVSNLSKPTEGAALPLLCQLDDESSHHTRDVLRLSTGDAVTAIDRTSRRRFHSTITATTPQVVLRLEAEIAATAALSRVHTLIFALCKGEKNDLVCQKACELGVSQILFWQTERSVVRIDSPKDREKKLERWKKIAAGAAQQSDRSDIPEVAAALSLAELKSELDQAAAPGDIRLVCSLESDARAMRELPPPAARVHLAIGPEGDFTAAEYAALKTAGFAPLSLGPLVLRAETAAIAAVAAANGLWGFCSEADEELR